MRKTNGERRKTEDGDNRKNEDRGLMVNAGEVFWEPCGERRKNKEGVM